MRYSNKLSWWKRILRWFRGRSTPTPTPSPSLSPTPSVTLPNTVSHAYLSPTNIESNESLVLATSSGEAITINPVCK